ncbi:MAG: tetratricopeptide repeat protein, partial [Myxococcota bacterium]
MRRAVGTLFGPYVFDGLLGVGGMAEVWAATHTLLRVQVAVKVLSDERALFVDRLLREGRVQASLDHPNLLPVRDIVEVGTVVGLVLPLVRGPSLDVLLGQRRLDEAEAIALFGGILDGVDHAHRGGWIHRDLKPANVLLEPRRGRVVPRVADFGLVKGTRDAATTQPGAMMGTVAYAAPEQLRDASSVDHRADLFSLGVILVELLSGHRPFVGAATASLVDAHHGPPDLTGVPDRWRDLCAALLAIDPAARPGDSAAVRAALASRPVTADALATTSPLGEAVAASTPTVPQSPRDTIAVASQPLAPVPNLPGEIDPFVGREADLRALAAQCDDSRLVNVLGPAGAGKTRLVLQFARRHAAAFPGGLFFCDLSDTLTPDGIVFVVAQALDMDARGRVSADDVATAIASRGRCLIILDNTEQLVDHAASTFGAWISKTTEAGFVITSRVRLGIAGETVLRLGPMEPTDAMALFAERARARKHDFTVHDGNRDDVATLVEDLDGLPLAIELAAARIRILSPRALRTRLEQRFRLLANRETTLRAAIDASWELLEPWGRTAFTQCSVFEGGFTLEAVEAVVDLADDDDAPWSIDVLQTLVDASLVRLLGENALGERRFGLLQSMRTYAREKLTEPAPVQDRHLAFYARFGGEQERSALHRFGGSARWWVLADEAENLAAAHRHAQARGDAVRAFETVSALHTIAQRTTAAVVAPFLDATLAMVTADPRLRAEVLELLANVQSARGNLDAAVRSVAEALELYRAVGERRSEVEALRSLGSLERLQGDTTSALERLEQALDLAESLGDPASVARVQSSLGIVQHILGRSGEAIRTYLAALATYRAHGNRPAEAQTLNNLAIDYLALGKREQAFEAYRSALAIHREVGNRRLEAGVLHNLALLHADSGRFDEARTAFGEALTIHRAARDRVDEGLLLTNQGLFELELGRLDVAEPILEESLGIHRAVGNRRFEALSTSHLGLLRHLRGHHDKAEALLRDAVALHREVRGRIDLTETLSSLGALLHEVGRTDEARAVLAESLELARMLGATGLEARVSTSLALVLASLGEPDARAHFERGERAIEELADERLVARVRARRARAQARHAHHHWPFFAPPSAASAPHLSTRRARARARPRWRA